MRLKLNVLIVDDEPLAAARVKRLLEGDPDVETIETAETPEAALELLRDSSPDVIFLDVEMPGMSGFELLEKLRPGKIPCVIFVTAYEEHALKAFDVHAVDYLLKPVTRLRLAGALQRAKNLMTQNAIAEKDDYARRIVIRERDTVLLLRSSEIDWLEADRKYVILHVGAKTFAVRQGISDFYARLDPSRFIRIHKSYIVNIDRVSKLQPLFHGEYRVLLEDGTALLLTRHYKKAIQAVLKDITL